MKHIDQKWKAYSLSLILSDWDTTPAAVLFDFLVDTEMDSLADLFDEHSITAHSGDSMKNTILDILAAVAFGLMLAFFFTIRG